MISSDRLLLLMECHDALSARVATSAGFDALWASGLSISSALGMRDANELSMAEILWTLEFIVNAVDVPVLVDGDGGFGNFNNARLLVRRLERLGAGGVVIEDKIFPKLNSFVSGRHTLTDSHEFAGKIRAAVDHRVDSNFVVVARTEALIAGQSVDEALERAELYVEAGADGIFIHSRRSDANQIMEFATKWNAVAPLLIAPTSYFQTPFSDFERAGIGACICANQNLRAAMSAMTDVCQTILQERSLAGVESKIAPLHKLFELLDYDELAAAEEKYLPKQ